MNLLEKTAKKLDKNLEAGESVVIPNVGITFKHKKTTSVYGIGTVEYDLVYTKTNKSVNMDDVAAACRTAEPLVNIGLLEGVFAEEDGLSYTKELR